MNAPKAAGKIHIDFVKGFIWAQVMKYEDFKEEGSENAVQAAEKYRQRGRSYIARDGDSIFFKFNIPQQLKEKYILVITQINVQFPKGICFFKIKISENWRDKVGRMGIFYKQN